MIESTGRIDETLMVRQPRPPRLQFEGAYYHAYTRGNRRERTFLDAADYREFEDTLLDTSDRAKVNLYAWCLMPNHFHLLIETPRANLAVFMQRLLTSYARYFNRRYRLVGHVFQGRYGAKLCDQENYLLELVRYIHLNPYRVKNRRWTIPEEGWPWSSHRYYVEGNEPGVVKPLIHSVLRRFGDDMAEARRQYAAFIAEGLAQGTWEDFYSKQQQRLGVREPFVNEERRESCKTIGSLDPPRLTLDQIIQKACQAFKMDEVALKSSSKEPRISQARKAIIAAAKGKGLASTSELAKRLGRTPSAISQLWHQVEGDGLSPAIREFAESIGMRDG